MSIHSFFLLPKKNIGRNYSQNPISSQWDLAFSGGITSKSPSLATTVDTAEAQAGYPISSPQYTTQNPQSPISTDVASQQQQQYPIQSQQYNTPPVLISAREWQRSVASVYDPEGAKRRWQSDEFEMGEYVKRRRG